MTVASIDQFSKFPHQLSSVEKSYNIPINLQAVADRVTRVASSNILSDTMQTAMADEVRDTVVSRVAASLETGGRYAPLGQAPLALLHITSAVSSCIGAYQRSNESRIARSIGWKEGVVLYDAETIKSLCNASGSTSNVVNRALLSTNEILRSEHIWSARGALSAASMVTNFVSSIFFGAANLFSFVSHAISLNATCKMIRSIEKEPIEDDAHSDTSSGVSSLMSTNGMHDEESAKKVENATRYLLNDRLNQSPEHIFSLLKKEAGDEKSLYERFDRAAKKYGVQIVEDQFKASQVNPSKHDKIKAQEAFEIGMKGDNTTKALIDTFCKDNAQLRKDLEPLSGMQILGFLICYHKEVMKQERSFSLVTSDNTLELAKKLQENRLLARLSDKNHAVRSVAEREAEDFVSKVKKDLKYNCIASALGVSLSLLGAVGSALVMGFSAGVGAIVGTSAVLFTNAMSFISDWMVISPGLADKNSIGKQDVFFAKVSVIISFVALVAAVATVSIFSFGAAPLILAAVGGIMALITSAYVYHKTAKKQQDIENANPSLTTLDKYLKSKKNDELLDAKTLQLISRLKESDQKKLKIEIAQKLSSGLTKELLNEMGLSNNEMGLSNSDKQLYGDTDFGKKYFQFNPSDELVKSSLLSLYLETNDMDYRHMHDIIVLRSNSNQIFDPTKTVLKGEKEKALYEKIRFSRIKTLAERFFDQSEIRSSHVKVALEELLMQK